MPLILNDATMASVNRVLSNASYWNGVPVCRVTLEETAPLPHSTDWRITVTVHYREPVYGRSTSRDIISLDALLAPSFTTRHLPIFHA